MTDAQAANVSETIEITAGSLIVRIREEIKDSGSYEAERCAHIWIGYRRLQLVSTGNKR
jgi:hypothetical protein